MNLDWGGADLTSRAGVEAMLKAAPKKVSQMESSPKTNVARGYDQKLNIRSENQDIWIAKKNPKQ